MPYVDSNLGDYVQNEVPLATLQEMVTAGTVPPNQVFLTPESEDVGMTNVYVNNELQKTLSFDRDPQTQITENKTNINKKLEPSNIKAGANINITTSGNDVTINAVAEAGGTVVNVNGVKQDVIDFTSDPQTQINSKFNSSNVVQSTGTSTTQVMSQKATTDELAKKANTSDLSNYLPLSGGTLTGNLSGKYITGTWLQSTQASDNANWTDVWVNSSGWLYKRTKASFKSDLGVPSVSQSTGTSTTDVMSQKATTDELTTITTALSNKFTNHPQSAYDCNACYDEGVYLIANGLNCPSGSQYGSLFVMPYRKPTGNTKPDFCTQIYIPNGDDSTDPNSMFYRTSLGSSWNNWQKVATTDELANKLNTSDLFNKIYPVGSIYLTVATSTTGSVSPASFFGGSWERLSEGYALWTASSGAGGTISAGLPDIIGTLGNFSSSFLSKSGAFYSWTTYSGNCPGQQWNGGGAQISFSAGKSNSIYGKSSTVQPPAIKVYAWKRIPDDAVLV